MSKKRPAELYPKKVYPKTNLSKAYYKHIVDNIEHDPLVKHTTLTISCMIAAICVLGGALIWYAKTNPGNLVQTSAKISNVSAGKTDSLGTVTTFISFDFATKDGQQKTVRQPADQALNYRVGQTIKAGYFPANPNYARNLSDNRPDLISIALWVVPFLLMIWLFFVALFRHHERQKVIWAAAEAAGAED